MIEQISIDHHIQRHIIGVLMYQKYARFRDMRPKDVDTNLYSYHLKLLQKREYIVRTSEGYTLGKNGILYVDRVTTSTLKVRTQPKIIVMLVVQNSDGDVLLYRRERQPFTNQWTLPYGKLHLDDETLNAAAHREAREKLRTENDTIRHSGDCYIRINDEGGTVMSTLAHIFRMEVDDLTLDDRQKWVRPHRLGDYELAPAVEKIITRSFFNDPYFFEEFEEAW
jgi:ADP-ribose pyrophosphatase YjhB (NUDIX family)